MKSSAKNLDLLHGSLAKNIWLFTLPIALSSMLQQLFNAADTSIVGKFDSVDALAAVGTNVEIVALIVTLSSGLANGANILVANQIGKQQYDALPVMTQNAVLLAAPVGLLELCAGQFAAAPLLRLIQTPMELLPAAAQYLRICFFGYPFLLLYDFGAAILHARGNSRYPFLVLTASGGCNVLLNLLFVLAFHLGVAGVAIATALSTALSAALVLHRLAQDDLFHLTLHGARLRWAHVGARLKTGVPAAVQSAVFCFANIFVQVSVNKFGPTAIAGSTIAMRFEYFTYYSITAFGQTATTFTSQNYAAGQIPRCRRVRRQRLGFSLLTVSAMIVPIVLFRRFFSGLFSPELPVIESACLRIVCILLFEPVCCLYEIPAGVLRGAGHAVLPALSTILGTCVFRITWICTVFRAHPGLETLYHAFPLSWAATIALVTLSYLLVRPLRKSNGKQVS